jgi:methionine-rich copper-binding protein CopC
MISIPHLRRRAGQALSLLTLSLLALAALVAFGATPVSAHPAHAKVLSAVPAIGSTITQAPTTITVTCAENINPDPKVSNLFVYAPNGDLISQGNAKVPLNNPKQMSISIKGSGNGVYVVRWTTVSADDGDPDQGAYVFTVKPQVSTTSSTSTVTSAPGNNASSNVSNGPNPALIGALSGLVGLVIGGGLAFAFAGRRSQPRLATMRQSIAEERQEEGVSGSPRS